MNIPLLTTELAAGHPDTGAYNVDDQLAADEINAVNRPRVKGADALRSYFWLEKFRIDDGEPSLTSIYGRLKEVANSTVGAQPFPATSPKTMTMKGIHAAQALLTFVEAPDSSLTILFNDARFNTLLVDAQAMGAFGSGDKTAIQALNNNQQSRAQELGLRFVGPHHVALARA